MVLPETDAQRLLVENGAVRGIRTGDKGRGRQGEELPTFEPGAELTAQATVLADGVQGMLSGAAIEHFGLQPENPQIYALGVKEVWRVARPLERVVHTIGWPLKPQARYREFGGTFAYPMGPDTICLGLVVGLDYADASLSVHDLLQEVKGHPLFRRMLEGGERIAWGAKAIPEGGFWSLPASVSPPGARDPRRRRGLRQRAAAEGRPLRAAERHAGRRDDPPRARRRRRPLAAGRALSVRRAGQELRDLPRPAPLPEHAPGLPARADRRRRAGRRDGHAAGRLPALAAAHASRQRAAGVRRQADATASATASSRSTSSPRSSRAATAAATTSRTTSASSAACRASSRSRGRTCARRRSTRSAPRARTASSSVEVTPSNCVQCGAITAKGGRLTPPEGGSGPEYTLT